MKKKMIKPLALFCCLMVSGSLYAQKVKIKKGEILVEDASVARIAHDNDAFTYATPDGKPVLVVKLTTKTVNGVEAPDSWLLLSSPDNKRSCELKQPSGRFTLSAQKAVTFMLFDANPKLMDEHGLQAETIDKLLQEGKHAFSHHWDSVNTVASQEIKQAAALAKARDLKISPKGEIMLGKTNVGKIARTQDQWQKKMYVVYDFSGHKIAEVNTDAIQYCPNLTSVVTFDERHLPIARSLMHSQIDMDDTAYNIVARLLGAGYPLGDMSAAIVAWRDRDKNKAAQQEMENRAAQLAQAKANSLNLYDVPCTVYFTDGQHETGKLTLLYELLEDKTGGNQNGIVNLANNLGRVAKLKTNGSFGTMTLKAKDHVILDTPGKKYIGVKGIGDNALSYLNAGDALAGVTKPAQFFEILYDDGHENYILQHPKEPGELLLLLKGKNEAVYLGNKALLGKRSTAKIASALDKYVGCPAMNAKSYSDFGLENIKKIIKDYREKCDQ